MKTSRSVPGPELGDYRGLPMIDARRGASVLGCRVQTLPSGSAARTPPGHIWRGPSQLTIRRKRTADREITAFHAQWLRSSII